MTSPFSEVEHLPRESGDRNDMQSVDTLERAHGDRAASGARC